MNTRLNKTQKAALSQKASCFSSWCRAFIEAENNTIVGTNGLSLIHYLEIDRIPVDMYFARLGGTILRQYPQVQDVSFSYDQIKADGHFLIHVSYKNKLAA